MTDITTAADPDRAPEAEPALSPASPSASGDKPARAHPWTDVSPHPWRRYLARMVDLTLFGLLAVAVLGAVIALAAPALMDPFVALLDGGVVGQYLISPLLMVTLSIPLMALSTGLTGGTLGKWLFGVRVANAQGRPIGFRKALVREAKVAWFGLGMGLPIVSLFLGFQAKERLEDKRATTWDKAGEFVITHRAVNAWQIVLMIVGGALFAAIRLYGFVERMTGMAAG